MKKNNNKGFNAAKIWSIVICVSAFCCAPGLIAVFLGIFPESMKWMGLVLALAFTLVTGVMMLFPNHRHYPALLVGGWWGISAASGMALIKFLFFSNIPDVATGVLIAFLCIAFMGASFVAAIRTKQEIKSF